MAEEPNQGYEQIQRDLLRTAIKQPLLDMIWDPANKDRRIPVIIEANDEYHDGKEKAVAEARRLVKSIADVDLQSIGSAQNPYYRTNLTPKQILDIVDLDDAIATKNAALPQQIAHYLAIRRIWYNHPISPMIDKSVSTVKADAAHRAFLAEGKDIVWAIIDSGIDGKHEHFGAKDTLK